VSFYEAALAGAPPEALSSDCLEALRAHFASLEAGEN
jgi:hypothetical protein